MLTANQDQITKAVGAHGMWKARLRSAIDTGKCDHDPAKVECDNLCDLGKWLHGTIDRELKAMPDYRQVVDQHAKFHKVAAKVLRLALTAQQADANKLMDGEFTAESTRLVSMLAAWKNK
ncbi:MAG: CZB domain-containing protein [Planctomycetes bacterium]|nr:CZB domain-containing protein [Planctomycetota bacterium]